jgi:hypothetical protein
LGSYVGKCVASAGNVIGNLPPGSTAAGTALTLGIREAIDRNSQRVIADAVTITTSALKERAEVLGAIALAIQASAGVS